MLFADPLLLYQDGYAGYFQVFCDVEFAEAVSEKHAVEFMQALQPQLTMKLAEARDKIL